MKKRLLSLFCILVLLVSFLPGAFADWEPPFSLSADEVLLLNRETGQVIYEHNADATHAIASLTKMMTALLLLESGEDLNTIVTIPERLEPEFNHIQKEDGARLELKTGEQISLEDLLYAMLLPSTNDAASAIADEVSGGDTDAFVAQMNQRAAELGCEDTHFTCPHGLYDGENHSTARDLAKIAEACLENERFMQVATTPSRWLPLSNLHTKVITEGAPSGMYLEMKSTIQLQLPESPLYRSYARGLKTGFTDAAGRCLVTSAETDSGSYLLILLGEPNEKDTNGLQVCFDEAARLLDWTVGRFCVGSLPAMDEPLASLPVQYCQESDSVSLYAAEPLQNLLLDGEATPEIRLSLPDSLTAPVQNGQVVGTAEIWQGEDLLGKVDLMAGTDCAYSARLYWQARLTPYLPWLAASAALLVLILIILLALLRARRKRRHHSSRR